VAFAKKGYHILLEKPMAISPRDCQAIVNAVYEARVMFAVCHVLRYTPYQQKIQEIIRSVSARVWNCVKASSLDRLCAWHRVR
jgi:predicted dehydrogenase